MNGDFSSTRFVVNRLPFIRKVPSLSAHLSQILNTVRPQTNTTWWKLRISAFQRYQGRGVSDWVYIGKSTYAYLKKFVVANATSQLSAEGRLSARVFVRAKLLTSKKLTESFFCERARKKQTESFCVCFGGKMDIQKYRTLPRKLGLFD